LESIAFALDIFSSFESCQLPYQILFAEETADHLRSLSVRDQRVVLSAISEQLPYQANVATRNRQPMRPNSIAAWKLRVGNLRVYYDIEEEPESTVRVLAIGVKERSQVRIGSRYLDL
jgi:mRNA-degrading endonuclease RelE of RelBE toxin-antitoxin system